MNNLFETLAEMTQPIRTHHSTLIIPTVAGPGYREIDWTINTATIPVNIIEDCRFYDAKGVDQNGSKYTGIAAIQDGYIEAMEEVECIEDNSEGIY